MLVFGSKNVRLRVLALSIALVSISNASSASEKGGQSAKRIIQLTSLDGSDPVAQTTLEFTCGGEKVSTDFAAMQGKDLVLNFDLADQVETPQENFADVISAGMLSGTGCDSPANISKLRLSEFKSIQEMWEITTSPYHALRVAEYARDADKRTADDLAPPPIFFEECMKRIEQYEADGIGIEDEDDGTPIPVRMQKLIDAQEWLPPRLLRNDPYLIEKAYDSMVDAAVDLARCAYDDPLELHEDSFGDEVKKLSLEQGRLFSELMFLKHELQRGKLLLMSGNQSWRPSFATTWSVENFGRGFAASARPSSDLQHSAPWLVFSCTIFPGSDGYDILESISLAMVGEQVLVTEGTAKISIGAQSWELGIEGPAIVLPGDIQHYRLYDLARENFTPDPMIVSSLKSGSTIVVDLPDTAPLSYALRGSSNAINSVQRGCQARAKE